MGAVIPIVTGTVADPFEIHRADQAARVVSGSGNCAAVFDAVYVGVMRVVVAIGGAVVKDAENAADVIHAGNRAGVFQRFHFVIAGFILHTGNAADFGTVGGVDHSDVFAIVQHAGDIACNAADARSLILFAGIIDFHRVMRAGNVHARAMADVTADIGIVVGTVDICAGDRDGRVGIIRRSYGNAVRFAEQSADITGRSRDICAAFARFDDRTSGRVGGKESGQSADKAGAGNIPGVFGIFQRKRLCAVVPIITGTVADPFKFQITEQAAGIVSACRNRAGVLDSGHIGVMRIVVAVRGFILISAENAADIIHAGNRRAVGKVEDIVIARAGIVTQQAADVVARTFDLCHIFQIAAQNHAVADRSAG